ncbi:MAG: phage portal protein [Clostridia bacterium]|nr:phage portal protein [Clostridia bacterium]
MAIVEKIQYSDDFLSEKNIANNINILWGKAIPILQHRKQLYDRYTRKNDTSDVIVALEFYISTIASGYFGGKEPQYKVKKINETQKGILKKVFEKVFGDKNNADEFQTIIDYITKYNDNSSFFYDCVKDYINTGACYGLIYENKDNEVVYAHTSSLTSVAIWNYETPSQKIGLLRYWTENSNNDGLTVHLELITKDYKKHYIDGIEQKSFSENNKVDFKEVKEDNKEVLWNDLPVFAVENPDGLALFENVMTLIKKHEQVIKNNANIFQYNDEAKLKITGFTPQNEPLIEVQDEEGEIKLDDNGNPIMMKNPARVKEDETILNAKVFYTPDNSGDIDWVIKNINDTASENHKKTCLDLALMVSGVPNVTDQGFTNADNSSALEKKFFPLDQVLQQADKLFEKELLRMWEIITNRINLKKNTEYDFRDIEIILTRNLPTNNQEITDNWLKLRGLLSDKTVIDHLPYDLDSESELAQMDEQNEANIEKNMENMQKMGQNIDGKALSIEQDNPNKQFEQTDEVKKENIKQSTSITEKEDKEE